MDIGEVEALLDKEDERERRRSVASSELLEDDRRRSPPCTYNVTPRSYTPVLVTPSSEEEEGTWLGLAIARRNELQFAKKGREDSPFRQTLHHIGLVSHQPQQTHDLLSTRPDSEETKRRENEDQRSFSTLSLARLRTKPKRKPKLTSSTYHSVPPRSESIPTRRYYLPRTRYSG